ncbi:MAG: hypothetical protein PHN64_04585 [Desulfovibrionaceae bacterium]|nr:hypothetical protein [Desulfovibrionaceae bacterium]
MRLAFVFLLAALAASVWCARDARHTLALEQKDHATTRIALQRMTQSRDAWAAAYTEALAAAQAQRENAAQCLQREAAASKETSERAAIMAQAKPLPRPAQSKDVVDDETRKRATARLNRPL